jgi:hypothetical protein
MGRASHKRLRAPRGRARQGTLPSSHPQVRRLMARYHFQLLLLLCWRGATPDAYPVLRAATRLFLSSPRFEDRAPGARD